VTLARVRDGDAMVSPTQACCSYKPGHGTHYIAPLRAYAATPRDPVSVVSAGADGWITFRDQESNEHRWWHHDGARLVALYEPDVQFWRVRDSRFLVAQRGTENSFPWIYCDVEPSPCVMERSADPGDAIENEGGFVMRPNNAAAVEGMVNSIANGIIKQPNAWRLANGLPPLEKD
jgi:hypothetical protein